MKYVLKTLPYDPRDLVEYTKMGDEYISANAGPLCFETRKLSEAMVWDDFDEIADYVEENKMDDCKIVKIKYVEYFKAILEGK